LVLFFKKELLVFTYFSDFLDRLGVTFFEKKHQKTLAPLRAGVTPSAPKPQ
jgi:hypothetical protein